MRLFYQNLNIGQKVKVQVYYGELTNNFYTGKITNMDGQNIVVEVETRDFNDHSQGVITQRGHEACNPEYAIVEAA